MKDLQNYLSKFIVFIALYGLTYSTSQAQIYKYHSLFLYTFTKYIQWPASYQSGDFVIGILGDSDIIEHLEALAASKTVGAQKISIKKFNSADQVTKCHMLFIPMPKSKELEGIIQKLEGQSTLLITEKPGMAEKGSGINFVIVEGKVKFELNRTATERFGLKISNELAKLAIIVGE